MVIQEKILDRSEKSVNEHLKEIGKIPLLTKEEELKYVKLYRAGDQKAKETLIKSNLRYGVSAANTYHLGGIKLGDLINEGNIGRIEGIEKYNPDRGARLLSYAVWHIQNRILDFLRGNKNICSIPQGKTQEIRNLKKVISLLEVKLGRDIYPSDLYGQVKDMSDFQINDAYSLITHGSHSTNQPLSDEGGTTVEDMLPSSSYDDIIQDEEDEFNIELLSGMINKLPTYQLRNVMNDYYGFNGKERLGRDGCVEKYQLTLVRIDQIHKDGIRYLKRIAKGEVFEEIELTQTEIYERLREKTRLREKEMMLEKIEESEKITIEVIKKPIKKVAKVTTPKKKIKKSIKRKVTPKEIVEEITIVEEIVIEDDGNLLGTIKKLFKNLF